MKIQKLKDGRLRDAGTGKVLKDAGTGSDVLQISKQLNTISAILREAQVDVKDLARNVRVREDDIDDEIVNDLGISLDRIQKAAKQAESVLRKFI